MSDLDYSYTTENASAMSALVEWTYKTTASRSSRVVPDGCRDLILKATPGEGHHWFVSSLSTSTYTVEAGAGETLIGIRLKPGTVISVPDISAWFAGRGPDELFGTDQIDEFCSQSDALSESLECLSSGIETVQGVARQLGVSIRTLQRLVKTETDHSPHFWISLGRARKAGRSLARFDRLAEAAPSLGFSDQAHMTREIKKWFDTTPAGLICDTELQALLSEPGYG